MPEQFSILTPLRRWRARWWLYDRNTATLPVFFFELAAYLLATLPLALAVILPPCARALCATARALRQAARWAWAQHQAAEAHRAAGAAPRRATRRGDDVVVQVTIRSGRAA